MKTESGLEVIYVKDTDMISCSNCKRSLMRIVDHTKNGPVLFKVTVDCPFCGDKSFLYDLHGPMKNIPAEGVQLRNVEQTGNITRFLTMRRSK